MRYLCNTNVGFSHLLINLTNLTSGVRKFPRLSDTILLSIYAKRASCTLALSLSVIADYFGFFDAS